MKREEQLSPRVNGRKFFMRAQGVMNEKHQHLTRGDNCSGNSMRASVPEAVLRGTSHRKAPMSSTRVIDAQFAHAMHDSLTLHIAITHSKPPTMKVGLLSSASTSAAWGESA